MTLDLPFSLNTRYVRRSDSWLELRGSALTVIPIVFRPMELCDSFQCFFFPLPQRLNKFLSQTLFFTCHDNNSCWSLMTFLVAVCSTCVRCVQKVSFTCSLENIHFWLLQGQWSDQQSITTRRVQEKCHKYKQAIDNLFSPSDWVLRRSQQWRRGKVLLVTLTFGLSQRNDRYRHNMDVHLRHEI